MTIEALLKAVSPPDQPYEAFVGPWEPVEAEIGTRLPHDYKELVRRYGNGYFMDFIGICVPLAENPHDRLENAAPYVRENLKRADHPTCPYAIWPDPAGLLPFGSTDNGDYLFWLPRGGPHSWPIVVWDRASGECELFGCNLTGFLAGIYAGTIRPKAFPPNLTGRESTFYPVATFGD